jgi:hypothetical protein
MKQQNSTINRWSLAGWLALSLMMAACGSRGKDPLQNYEALKHSVPAYKNKLAEQITITRLFEVEAQESLNFFQGEEKTVHFKVHLYFDNNSTVRYHLEMSKGPSAQGATLTRIDGDTYALKWHPSNSLLTTLEDNKNFDLQLKFVLDNSSSAISKANMVGVEATKDWQITLYKEKDQPVIEESEASPIKLIPGAEVNADQDVKIQFVAAAKGLHKAEDLKINFDRGPQEPSLELAQFDGYPATDLHATQVRSLGQDAQGRTRYEYSLTFHSREFADQLQKKIDGSAKLKDKFARGALTAGEAVFYLSAYNEYSQRLSAQRQVVIKVNLTDKAGEPKLVGETGVVNATIGTQTAEQFFIKSEATRGEIKINGLHFAETQPEKEKLTISQDGVDLKLTCQPGGTSLGEIMGCKTGGCVKSCQLQVMSSCEAKETSLNLIINAESVLGASKQQKDLNLKVNLKGKAANCTRGGQKS